MHASQPYFPELSPAVFGRSLVSPGNTSRLRRVFDKAWRGGPVTFGVIGGSITQWVRASEPRFRYADRVAAWLAGTFPRSDVRLVNAGRGATGSNYGALRAHRDLLRQNPDLVVVEFAVNDGPEPHWAEPFEGLVRQILAHPAQPAVVLLFMMYKNGGNVQDRLTTIGRHYGLPMVSYRDALWPEITAGRLTWDDISPDDVHPNDRGHACAADFVTHCLQAALTDPGVATDAGLPRPLHGDEFQHTSLFEAPALVPVTSLGWSLDAHGEPWPLWRADAPGSEITFDVAGRQVLLMYYRIRGPMGRVEAQIDDQPPTIHDAWFDQTWGGYRETVTIARGLGPGRHRVRLRLLADRHAESDGHQFSILGLGAAGVTEPGITTLQGVR